AADSNGTAITAITYNREGFATTVAGFPNTTITLHEQTSNAAYTRCLRVMAVGMLTTETPCTNPSRTCSCAAGRTHTRTRAASVSLRSWWQSTPSVADSSALLTCRPLR